MNKRQKAKLALLRVRANDVQSERAIMTLIDGLELDQLITNRVRKAAYDALEQIPTDNADLIRDYLKVIDKMYSPYAR